MTSWGALGLLSPRVRRGVALSWSALFVLSLLLQYFSFALASPVVAVHDEGLFELDGNAASTAAPGDDWDKVNDHTSSADSTKFIVDPVDSAETEPVSDTASVAVLPPPLALTPPPTDSIATQTSTSNPGFALMLILVGVAGLALGVGFITPVPERVRRRERRR